MMPWFKSKQVKQQAQDVSRQAIVQIVANKAAKKEVIAEAKQANDRLNKLLIENGFTLKIYLAAGGKDPHTKGK